MPNRTDHAAEARNALWRSEGEPTCDAAGATLARAQVHATLALIEQQYLANRIAYARLVQERQMHTPIQFDDQIREALGL